MRTFVYVDGFNLYYRMLKNQPSYKWLNVHQLGIEVLGQQNQVLKTRYFTARVSGRADPDAPARQQILIEAFGSVPEIEVHFGNFLVTKIWAGLVTPDLDPAIPNAKPPFMPWPRVARVFKTEEKGSDVNLACHLLHDAYQNRFDVAAVISNDTDLTEPIRIVTQELGKIVGLLTPVSKPATSLRRYAAFCHHIRPQHLTAAAFPNPLVLASGKALNKPPSWA